jgi:hypothetical protein
VGDFDCWLRQPVKLCHDDFRHFFHEDGRNTLDGGGWRGNGTRGSGIGIRVMLENSQVTYRYRNVNQLSHCYTLLDTNTDSAGDFP